MNFFTRKKIFIIIIVLAVLGIGGVVYVKSQNTQGNIVKVVVGTVREEVSLTGKTKPEKEVTLAFETIGRISKVNVSVGDKVYAGQVLATQDSAGSVFSINKAKSALASDIADLSLLEKGTRSEDLAVSQTKVDNAEASLADAQRSFVDTLKDSFTKSDNAIRNNVDQLFTNPRSQNPDFVFTVSDQQLKTSILQGRVALESMLLQWNATVSSLSGTNYTVDASITVETNLNTVRDFLDKVALVVNILSSNYSLSQTTITTYKNDVSTARSSINTAIANLSSAKENVENALSAKNLALNELDLAKAGTVAEKIDAARAKVEGDKAEVSLLEHDLQSRFLQTPISGVVTKQEAKVGEIASPSTALISIHSAGELEIEVNVPEADVARIVVGNDAEVTLDAYGSDVLFKAKVLSIDPAETLIDNVPTYKTTFAFTSPDARIKSGMTANITIVSAKHENVLVIPGRAIFEKEGKKFVNVLNDDGTVNLRDVTPGLKGIDGNVEILNGLIEGEKVLIDIPK